ncbi:helix-turn-helix domain-containing protein [Chondromyces apiculatus]|uniref:HTH cro/C1-type domain-containing protein n=1 Tax=Chondromyces apiculatus DSM 436 TaxID=1192034 RepID=A0A017TGQ3_9BACT|nr:helix-turn-helix domain-containing protein [Chondromyces apiculatus]EYF07796.1 Hypothetical protein CAP_6818 [Chondromyces apiculatus DSM 436]
MVQVFNHEALLRARIELNLTQEQLAAAVGVDVRTYRRYETGAVNDPTEGFSVRHPTRRRMIERLSAELGLPGDELLIPRPTPGPAPPAAPPQIEPPRALAPEPTSPDAPPAPLPPSPPSLRPLHVHALQRARHFVGRDAILAELRLWVDAPRPEPRVLTLLGVGGAGKTSILEHLLAELGDAPREGGVFVWSFYEDQRIEAFLSEALRYFAAGAAFPPGERLLRLEETLRAGPPHLLALDGLEVVQAEGGAGRAHGEIVDPLLRRLFCALARGLGVARALVTSRFALADLDPWTGQGSRGLPLSTLTTSEAALLLRRWGVHGDERTLRDLSATSGGHALSVAVLGSYVGGLLGGDPAAVRAATLADAALDDPLARRLARVLSAYASALPPAERDLLARLSLLPAAAAPDALLAMIHGGGDLAGAMLGWGPAELRRGLGRLERLGLVFTSPAPDPRYSTHPFIREHFRALAPPDAASTLLQRGPLAPGSISTLPPPPPDPLASAPRRAPRDPASLDLHEALLHQLLDAGRARDAWDVYTRSLGGFTHLGLVLGEMSRGARVLRAFSTIEPPTIAPPTIEPPTIAPPTIAPPTIAPPGSDDPQNLPDDLPPLVRAELAYERGLYAAALGDLAFARRCYEAHNTLGESLGASIHLTTGLRTLAYTERLAGAFSRALHLIDASIALAEREGYTSHLTRGLALRAILLHDLGEGAAAAQGFAAARAHGDRLAARRGLWEVERMLALGAWQEAEEATRSVLHQSARLGWQGHTSHAHALLGRATLERGDLGAAAEHLTLARQWVATSGEVEAALRCHELAARLALAVAGETPLDGAAAGSTLARATQEAEAGLHLATLCGFAPARTRLAILAARAALPRGAAIAATAARAALASADPGDAWGRLDALSWAGALAQRAGDPAAAQLLQQAATLRAQLQ